MLIKKLLVSGLVITTVLNTKIGEVEKNIPDYNGLVTITVLNTKIREVENKIPDDSKYVTTPEFNKFADEIFDPKSKQAKLATGFSKHANKSEEKIEKLQTFDFSYFVGNFFFWS